MKPHEFEALVRTKALVVKQAPEPVVESSPAPVLEAMDIDSLDHQYQTMLDEGWFDNQTSDAENDAKVAGRRNFLKAVGTGLAGAGLAAAGLGASQNAQAGNAPEIKMQDARHGTVAYQGKNIPITLNDTTRAMGTLAKAKLNGQTVDIRIGLDGARAWIPPSAMPHMGESMMAGGTEAYTMEDEQLDGMALGELQAIVQAAKKIFASVKQGVPLEAWMYKKITNGNEGLTAVAQQINNPAVREQPGVAEGAPIVVMPSHKRLEKKHKPSLSRGMDPAKAQGEQDARDGKPYNNPYPFKKELGAPGNWEHNSYKASYDSVKQGVAEGSDEGKTGKNFAKIAPTLKPLTDEQILEIDDGLATWMFPVDTRVTDRELAFARAIEAAHGIKEQDMTPQIRMKGNVPGDKIKEQGVAEGSDQPVGYIDDEGKLVTIGHKPGFAKSVGHANGGWIDTGRAIPDSWKAVYTKNLEQGVAEGNVEKTTTGLKHTRDYEYPTKGREFNKDLDRLNKTQTGILDKALGVEWTPTNKRKEITGDQTGVAENFEPGETKRVLKSGGKPAGEIGLDPEASPGNGAYYIKHYASGKDLGGYDTYQEALEELRYIDKQYQHANRPADTRSKHQKMMDNPAYAEGYRDGKRGVTGKNVADIFGPMSDVYHQGYKAGKQGVTEGLTEIKKGQKDSNGYTKCWPGKHAEGTKKGKNGGQVRNCVPNESVEQDPNDPQWSKKYNKDVGESTTKIPTGLKHHGDYGSKYPPEEYRDEYGHRVRGQKYVPGHEENEYDHRGRPPKAPLAKVELPADAFGRVSGKVPKGKQGIRISGKSNTDESTDYASAVNNLLNEFAGGMGVSSVAVGPGAMKNPAKTGSLFGGSYTQKNSPFKKKATKKESVIKR